jgi:hypothetical protein
LGVLFVKLLPVNSGKQRIIALPLVDNKYPVEYAGWIKITHRID